MVQSGREAEDPGNGGSNPRTVTALRRYAKQLVAKVSRAAN